MASHETELDWQDKVSERWRRAVTIGQTGSGDGPHVPRLRTLRLPFWRLTVPVLITGVAGTGKSTLYDALLGEVGVNYHPRPESTKEETHRIQLRTKTQNLRSGLIVVPGDDSSERRAILQRVSEKRAFPTGVIHCVSYGYRKVWTSIESEIIFNEVLARQKPELLRTPADQRLSDWRDEALKLILHQQRREEAADFADLCNKLQEAWRGEAGPFWLILAVTKCDLFWDRLGEVVQWYVPNGAPTGDTDFSERVRQLVYTVGAGRLTIAALPICSYTEQFTFNTQALRAVQDSRLDQKRQGVLLDEFKRVLGDLCERR
jgi:hypothetical protein